MVRAARIKSADQSSTDEFLGSALAPMYFAGERYLGYGVGRGNFVAYRPIQSRFGPLFLHQCPALDNGPDWTRRERLVVDAGASDSRVNSHGKSIPFHGHLFRDRDGFRFSERDRRHYPAELLDELEDIANRALI